MKEKKVVDLIYIEPEKPEKVLFDELNAKIDFWGKRLKAMQEFYFEQNFDAGSPDVLEVMMMRKFLNKFLQNRLNWISEIKNEKLRQMYLKVLPPFTQKGGIQSLLLHFFQIKEIEDKKNLEYQEKNNVEKEIRILWDIYKLRKTVDSINTMLRASKQEKPFKSVYSAEKRIKCLTNLKSGFNLLFQMCIQKQYQKKLYNSLSAEHITPEAILERHQNNISYVYPHVIEKFNYRNHFFYMYFFPGMKAKVGGEAKTFHFNYLDFELIKQDFLIDWMNQKLKGNDKKYEIYEKYKIGEKTVADIIKEAPEREIEVLKQLPLNLFNDITAEVNDNVSDDLKVDIDPLSDNHGEFSRVAKKFELARSLAKVSIEKVKAFVSKKAAPEPDLPPKPEPVPEPEPQKLETVYDVIKVKNKQINFPYFQQETKTYQQKLALQRVKMGNNYAVFGKYITKLFNNISESNLITRRTPKHEWTMPFVIKEITGDEVINHLLILGAEVKAKQLGMGYSAKAGQNAYQFTCYLIYGCDQSRPEYGEPLMERHARGIKFSEYNWTNPAVQKELMKFFKLVEDDQKK